MVLIFKNFGTKYSLGAVLNRADKKTSIRVRIHALGGARDYGGKTLCLMSAYGRLLPIMSSTDGLG